MKEFYLEKILSGDQKMFAANFADQHCTLYYTGECPIFYSDEDIYMAEHLRTCLELKQEGAARNNVLRFLIKNGWQVTLKEIVE